MKHSSRGEVLHPEHIQRDEVGSVVPEQLAELIAVHESAAGHIEVGNSPEKCGSQSSRKHFCNGADEEET